MLPSDALSVDVERELAEDLDLLLRGHRSDGLEDRSWGDGVDLMSQRAKGRKEKVSLSWSSSMADGERHLRRTRMSEE